MVGEGSSAGELERLRERVAALEQAERERIRAEPDLVKSHANLLALLENTDDFILFSDREARPVFFNSAYARVIKRLLGIDMRPGLKPHELLSDPAERALWDGFHRRVLHGERFSVEVDVPDPADKVRQFEVRYSPVLQDGEIIGFSEFARDITDRKRDEAALRNARDRLEQEVIDRTHALTESEARFRALTERSADVTLIVKADGRCLYVTPSIRSLGYEPAQLLGRMPDDFAHPEDLERLRQAFQRAVDTPGQTIAMGNVRVRSAAGRYRVFDGTVAAHFDVRGIEGLVLNVHDITEHVQLEARLRQAEKMDAIGQLAGGVAHDFNNQLTGILANAEILTMQLDDPDLRGLAEQIVKAARRSADLTGTLLAFARKGHFRSVALNVGELLAEVARLLEHSIDKRIRIELDRAPGPLGTLGDPSQLQNAFLNLGINARDAMPEGGKLVLRARRVELDMAAAGRSNLEPGHYISVSVTDTGVGMDAETQRRIFEPFFTTKPAGKGTGMGLTSVYGTVRGHGGAISVESAPGAGTCFEVLLPEKPEEQQQPAEAPSAGLPEQGLSVLVVDDEAPVRALLGRLLGTLGHTATLCRDGEEALERMRETGGAFDLAILDMVMPRMSGRETFLALRELSPQLRILVSSGYTVEGGAQELLDRGAAGFLQKPFGLDELARAVENAGR